jgi:ribonucleoside-diphosphate reductase alpha chain
MVQGHNYVKMATSVIDYIFRDLGISYLGRTDLGQIKPEDLLAPGAKSDSGGPAEDQSVRSSAGFRIHRTAFQADGSKLQARGDGTGGAENRNAAKAAASGSPAGKSGGPAHAALGRTSSPPAETPRPGPEPSEQMKIAQARLKGYEGDPCPACGSFTLVRNGTCMKCDTCGGTTGCS